MINKTVFCALTAGGALCGLLGFSGPAAHADNDHPNYLHALSDLRAARAYLWRGDERNVVANEKQALRAIDDAIEQCRRASIRDGKDLADTPPVDVNLSYRDRLQKAATLLDGARLDLSNHEDDRSAQGWRNRALSDVNTAFKFTHRAMSADFHDDHASFSGDHPHYLHALAELRTARAYLDHGDEPNVMVDQKNAITEIDEAIGEIRHAAIDDGKDPDDAMSIDVHLNHRGRIDKAIALITSARRDLSFTEGDRAALGWRKAAQNDLNDALTAARKAERDNRFDRE